MDTSEIIAVASACIAGLALAQSRLAGRKASRATAEANELIKQQVALQDRLTQIEQSREHAKLMQSLQAEIDFNRYFYRYTPPGQLDEIDLKRIAGEIADMLAEVTE